MRRGQDGELPANRLRAPSATCQESPAELSCASESQFTMLELLQPGVTVATIRIGIESRFLDRVAR